jgi:TonB family protein
MSITETKCFEMKIGSILLILLLNISTFSFGQKEEVDNGYEKGLLVDGYKEGVWEYYENNILKIKVDYTTGKLVYLAKDTVSYAIENETGWEMSKLDIPPRYVGSMEELIKILAMNVRYPVKAKNRSNIGTVLLGFEINLQGNVENVKILKDIGNGCGDEVLRVFQFIPNIWLVAQKNGQNYKSRYILPVKFQIGERTSNGDVWKDEPESELEELNEAKAAYQPTNYLEEVVISAVQL